MENRTNRFLSGIAYSVGIRRDIETLSETDGVSAEILADLKQRGLRQYYEEERSIPVACMSSALDTLKSVSLAPEEIDIILLATSNAHWVNTLDEETALFAAFREAGFSRTRLIGVSLQACSAFGESARIAADLIGSENSTTKVLVILFGRKETPSRLGPAATTVYSDGAASCIVWNEPTGFEIVASESLFNITLGAMGRLGNFDQFVGGVQDLGDICKRVYEKAGTSPENVRTLFCTNGSLVHLRVMANAAKIPIDRVYGEDVARFAHVYSCDNLISLKNYASENKLQPGDQYLLLGWSPHVVSAAILRYAKGT
jgi:3-oxoacyl-[acyl-carrier-protein] synthase III